MGCEKVQNLLCEYLDKELNEIETKYVEKHLGECFNCLKEFEALKKTTQVVGALPDVSVPKDFRKELSARLDNRNASVVEIFAKRRAWLPTLSLALAAMLLIIVFNKQYGFLNMKSQSTTAFTFQKIKPFSDSEKPKLEINDKILSFYKNGHPVTAKPAARKNEKANAATPLQYKENNVKKTETKKQAATVKKKPVFKPETTESPKTPEAVGEKKLKGFLSETGKNKEKAADKDGAKKDISADEIKLPDGKLIAPAPAPTPTDITLKKEATEAESYTAEEKKKTYPVPGMTAPAEKATTPIDSAATTTGAGLYGGTMSMQKAETTGPDDKKEIKPMAKISTKAATAATLTIELSAENPQKAYDDVKALTKSYTLDHVFGHSITIFAPQNKINYLIGKLRNSGSVSAEQSYDAGSPSTIKVKIVVKQKEEK